jgi:methyl-accepting chemotaxis protein
MSAIEIVLIIIGVVILLLGYFMPTRGKDVNGEMRRLSEEEIRKMVSGEVDHAKGRVADIVDETVNYAVEKSERAMERITNEKIMAVNEYSDTVLDEINKNHQEVVFLYDMLNDKHDKLMTTINEATQVSDEVKQSVKDVEITAKETVTQVQAAEETANEAAETAADAAEAANEALEATNEALDNVRETTKKTIEAAELAKAATAVAKDANEAANRAVDTANLAAEMAKSAVETAQGAKETAWGASETAKDASEAASAAAEQVKGVELTAKEAEETMDSALQSVKKSVKKQEDLDALHGAKPYHEDVVGEVQTLMQDEAQERVPSEEPEETAEFKPITPRRVEIIHQPDGDYIADDQEVSASAAFAEMGIFNAKPEPESEPVEEPKRKTRSRRNLRKENAEDGHGVDLRFDKGRENGRNSNERILELHKAGKSNMAIAKELGLGLGEVKLVIDLFEGM